MPNLPIFIVSLLGYVLIARFSLSFSDRKLRMLLFCCANIAGFIWLSLLTRYYDWEAATILSLGYTVVVRHIAIIGFYVFLMAIGYYLVRAFAKRDDRLAWVPFFYPLAILIVFKYFYFLWGSIVVRLNWEAWVIGATIIGLSYMTFRLSYLVLEVRNGTAEMPSLSEYLGFAFFVPIMLVGPINPFSNHQSSVNETGGKSFGIGTCLLRITVGATKFLFLANLANQLSYRGIFLDGKPHGLIDLAVAGVFYYLFLYCNFSGICDMAIGIAGLIGIRVKENFNNPFKARNVKEFWNRWHITLSEYMRDVVFSPLSKALIKKFGVKYVNSSIAVSIFVVFLLIGIWHGVGWHYAVFGLIHGVGVSANHYYTIWMKRKLGKEGYKKYNENPVVNAVAVVLTFGFVAASLGVFANDYEMMMTIKDALYAGL